MPQKTPGAMLAFMSSSTRILIIDDDRELGGMLAEYLTGEGWQIDLRA